MDSLAGTVLQCGRYGCVVRLSDGRFAMLPPDDPGIASVRNAVSGDRHPTFTFRVWSQRGGRPTLELVADDRGLERKIIDYLRQASEANAASGREEPERVPPARAERLLPFEMRARRQYRDDPKRPRRSRR